MPQVVDGCSGEGVWRLSAYVDDDDEVYKTEMGDISETLVAWTDKVEKFKDWWIVPNELCCVLGDGSTWRTRAPWKPARLTRRLGDVGDIVLHPRQQVCRLVLDMRGKERVAYHMIAHGDEEVKEPTINAVSSTLLGRHQQCKNSQPPTPLHLHLHRPTPLKRRPTAYNQRQIVRS